MDLIRLICEFSHYVSKPIIPELMDTYHTCEPLVLNRRYSNS